MKRTRHQVHTGGGQELFRAPGRSSGVAGHSEGLSHKSSSLFEIVRNSLRGFRILQLLQLLSLLSLLSLLPSVSCFPGINLFECRYLSL